MSDARTAYAAAQALIEKAREDGAISISFDIEDCRALTRIPPEIGKLTALTSVDLDKTAITDLTPLSPLTGLRDLHLDGTEVTDLRPLRDLEKLGTNRPPGLTFRNTPATARDAELDRLAKIEDEAERAEQTRAYLHTLPPWPDPLPQKGLDSGTGARREVRTAQAHIAFLLEHAAASQVSAETTASQIRHALRDVPATDGNKLPPVLQTMLAIWRRCSTGWPRPPSGPITPNARPSSPRASRSSRPRSRA